MNSSNPVRNNDACQVTATRECTKTDICNTIRHYDAFKITAIIERTTIDICNSIPSSVIFKYSGDYKVFTFCSRVANRSTVATRNREIGRNYGFGVIITANTGICCATILGCSGGSYCRGVGVFIQRRDDFLCYNNFSTNGAVLTFGETYCGASRCNRLVDNFGVTAVEFAAPSEVEVSEVLSLFSGVVSCGAVLDSDGVLTSLESNIDAYHVSGEVVNVIFVTGSSNSGAFCLAEVESGLEGVLISSACVDGVYCATVVVGALHSHVDCELVNTSLVYVNFVFKILWGLVSCGCVTVNVRECHSLATSISVFAASDFVVPNVVDATNGRRKNIFYSVDVVNAFTCKLCRKCIVEIVNVVLTIIVCVVIRDAFNLCRNKCATFNGALAFCIQGVTRGDDNCLGCVTVQALVSALTFFGTSRSDNSCNFIAVGMTENDFLRHKHLTANGAVLALGETSFVAGRGFYCFVDYFGMSISRNDLLRYKNLVTYGAVFACCKTCSGAGGGDCRVDCLCVTKGRNNFLCYENFATNGAVFALGKTSRGAGRSNCLGD